MIKLSKSSRFWLLLTILIVGGSLIHWREAAGEIQPERKQLKEFAAQFGDWRRLGADRRFDETVESVLRADDYLLRDYYLPNNRTANVYVGYYNSQRTGATYHSPRNCLPGSGWTMTEPKLVDIDLPNGERFAANSYIVQNGKEKQLMIYWYQGRGRFTANEYADKFLTVWDSVRLRRSDAAMVRVITPVADDESEAMDAAKNLAQKVAASLSEFVPN